MDKCTVTATGMEDPEKSRNPTHTCTHVGAKIHPYTCLLALKA